MEWWPIFYGYNKGTWLYMVNCMWSQVTDQDKNHSHHWKKINEVSSEGRTDENDRARYLQINQSLKVLSNGKGGVWLEFLKVIFGLLAFEKSKNP